MFHSTSSVDDEIFGKWSLLFGANATGLTLTSCGKAVMFSKKK
ncbi:MAG: hypothetical protein ACKOZZ_06545 [Bacteroidota bacterium]